MDRVAVAGLRRRAGLILTLLGPAVAAHFALAYVYGTNPYVDLHDYITGHARLPFQYRALPAWIMRAVLALPGWRFVLPAPYEQLSAERFAEALLAFASVLWILHSARQAAATICRDALLARGLGLTFIATIYLNYATPAYAQKLSYPYDLPSLALVFASFVAILYRRNAYLLALFALATAARETSIILVAILLCWRWPANGFLPHRQDGALAAVMVAIWLAVKTVLHAVYGQNLTEAAFMHQAGVAGGMVLQIGGNVLDMMQPIRWPVALSIVCWLWLPVFAFWGLIDHAPLRRCIRLITPYWVIAMCLLGALRETRIFGELTILYWMASLVLLRAAWRLYKGTYIAPANESGWSAKANLA